MTNLYRDMTGVANDRTLPDLQWAETVLEWALKKCLKNQTGRIPQRQFHRTTVDFNFGNIIVKHSWYVANFVSIGVSVPVKLLIHSRTREVILWKDN